MSTCLESWGRRVVDSAASSSFTLLVGSFKGLAVEVVAGGARDYFPVAVAVGFVQVAATGNCDSNFAVGELFLC